MALPACSVNTTFSVDVLVTFRSNAEIELALADGARDRPVGRSGEVQLVAD
jgi:hypothetical protein